MEIVLKGKLAREMANKFEREDVAARNAAVAHRRRLRTRIRRTIAQKKIVPSWAYFGPALR